MDNTPVAPKPELEQKPRFNLNLNNTEIYTKVGVYLASALIVLGCILYIDSAASTPTSSQIEPTFRVFVSQMELSECPNGIFNMTEFTQLIVGTYNDSYRAWPVYASYGATCQAEKFFFNKKVTYDPSNKTPVAYMQKKGFGGYRFFLPKPLSESKQELEGSIKQQLDKIF